MVIESLLLKIFSYIIFEKVAIGENGLILSIGYYYLDL